MQKLEARYGLFMAISMVIGQVIGSGIFFKVDDILVATQSNSLAGLLGFAIVGICVVFAAASMANYAELLPTEGGIISYVGHRFGKRAATFVGWGYMILFYPILAAVLLTVSGIYISHFFSEFISFEPTFLHYSLIGLMVGIIFFVGNIFLPLASGKFQEITTVLKLIPLILISAFGIISLLGNNAPENQYPAEFSSISESSSFWVLVASSFIPIAFSMDGWYVATQISGELKNSKKNLPRALIIGSIVVLLVYTCYYTGIVSQMNNNEIIALKDTYITEFARKVTNNTGAIIIQLFIIISVLGTSNGLMLATIRVPYQFYNLEKSKKFLNLGAVDTKTQMPIRSAFLALGIIIFYLIIFHLTNTLPYFTEKGIDISAVPITFIYIVNMALFIGLLKLIKERKLSGNPLMKYIMVTFAIVGTGLVIVGSLIAPNGLLYLLIAAVVVAVGAFFIKK